VTHAHFVLEDERTVLEGDYFEPVLAPEGTRLAITRPSYDELHVLDLSDGTLALACRAPRCGLSPRWTPEGLRMRGAHQSATAVPDELARLDDRPTTAAAPFTPSVHAWIGEDDMEVQVHAANLRRSIRANGDRIVRTLVSPDDRHVALWGMSTGIYIHDVARDRTLHLGRGEHPAFDESGARLVFERTEDDGHEITGGDLFLVELRDDYVPTALTSTADRIERTPSLARDRLAFVVDGSVRVARLRRR
jgi:hypothetical protein